MVFRLPFRLDQSWRQDTIDTFHQYCSPEGIIKCVWDRTPMCASTIARIETAAPRLDLREVYRDTESSGIVLWLQTLLPSGQTRRGTVSLDDIYRMIERYEKSEVRCRDDLSALLTINLTHKMVRRNDDSCAYKVHPSFYILQRLTTVSSIELFADCLNESGVMDGYYSLDSSDLSFGSLGKWSAECDFHQSNGAVGNPPFEFGFLSRILCAFDSGVRRNVPYCRVILVPLYVAQFHVRDPNCPALVIARIKARYMGFKSQAQLFDYNCEKPGTHINQRFAVMVWINATYQETHSFPEEVESAYKAWGLASFGCLDAVVIDECAMLCAFPPIYRTTRTVSHHFGAC